MFVVLLGPYISLNNFIVALKYFKLSFKNGKYSIIHNISRILDKMDNYSKATKYFKKSVELLTIGLITPNNIYNGYENMFLKNKNDDGLVTFYTIKKNTRIVDHLNKTYSSGIIQSGTIASVANYFNDSESKNALHSFIKNLIRSNVALLDLHFEFTINSSGYACAKENFYKR